MLGLERLYLSIQLVIDKSKTPQCSRAVKSLKINYSFNSKVWIIHKIFRKWIEKLKKCVRQNKKTALFVENCLANNFLKPQETKVVFFLLVSLWYSAYISGDNKNLNLYCQKRILIKIVLLLETINL